MVMTRSEGEQTERLARGESVPGGPGACGRKGCGHAKVWHDQSNRVHACEKCDCPRYVTGPDQRPLW